MKTSSVLVVLFALTLGSLSAQNQSQKDGNYAGIAGFWEVVTSNGRFVVRLDQTIEEQMENIASVSEHEYPIDGGIRAYEVTVTEQTALEALQLIPYLSTDEEKRRALKLVRRYESAQDQAGKPRYENFYRQRAQQEADIRRMFQDRERHGFDEAKLKNFHQTFRLPEQKARFLNDRFLAYVYRRPTGQIRMGSPSYRDAYSSAKWGVEGLSDSEFYKRLGDDFDFEDSVHEKAQQAGLQGLTMVEASEMLREMSDGQSLSHASKKDLEAFFETTRSATSQRVAPYRSTVDWIVDGLQTRMGVEGANETNVFVSDLAEALLDVPKEDRDFVISAIIANGGEGEEKGFWKKFGENFVRGSNKLVSDFVLRSPAMNPRHRGALLNARKRIASGMIPAGRHGNTAKAIAEYSAGQLSHQLGPGAVPRYDDRVKWEQVDPESEKVQKALELIDREIETDLLVKQLVRIAEEEIDPAKGEYRWRADRSILLHRVRE